MANKRRLWIHFYGGNGEATLSARRWIRFSTLKTVFYLLFLSSVLTLLLFILNFGLTQSTPTQRLKLLQMGLDTMHSRYAFGDHSPSIQDGRDTVSERQESNHTNAAKLATSNEQPMKAKSEEFQHSVNSSQLLGRETKNEDDEIKTLHPNAEHPEEMRVSKTHWESNGTRKEKDSIAKAAHAERSAVADPKDLHKDSHKDLHKDPKRKSHKDLHKDPHKDPHKDLHKDHPKDSPQESLNVNARAKKAKKRKLPIDPTTTIHAKDKTLDQSVGGGGGSFSPNTNLSYWTEVPDTLPAWARFSLHWTEGPIPRGHPHWQVLGGKGLEAFLYSAHLDNMVSPALVRVVGILHKMVSFMNVTCRYYDDLYGPGVHSVSGTLYHFRSLNGRRYVGAYVDCPLPGRSDYLPYAVSVSRTGEDEQANFMIVHYSQSDAWLKQQNYTFYAKRRQRQDEGEGEEGEEGSQVQSLHRQGEERKWEEAGTGSGWRWNITRCFPAFQRKLNAHLTLAEMAAASMAMGVQRFVFYVESAGPDLLRMMKVLVKKGLAEVHPWNLHMPGPTVFYHAQSSAIQECFYRHLSSSKFMLFGDIDELFVPRQNRSLLPLLNEVFGNNSKCGTAAFRNIFFNVERATKAPPHLLDPLGYATQHQLNMLTHTRRIERIWPMPRRTKPAVDPRRALTPGIHTAERLRKGYELCEMHPKQGLLHHYRVITPKQSGPTAEIEDTSLWQYTPDIIRNYQELMQEFHNDAKGRP